MENDRKILELQKEQKKLSDQVSDLYAAHEYIEAMYALYEYDLLGIQIQERREKLKKEQ